MQVTCQPSHIKERLTDISPRPNMVVKFTIIIIFSESLFDDDDSA
jgi:hypothetical protein